MFEKQPERLGLNFKSCNMSKDDITKLNIQLQKAKHNLMSLDLNLSDNNLEKDNFPEVANIIKSLQSLKTLSLNLTNNFCDDIP